LFAQQGGEDLDGFAEAHVVGEAGTEAGAGTEPEPVETARLIGAEGGAEGWRRRRGIRGGEAAEGFLELGAGPGEGPFAVFFEVGGVLEIGGGTG